MKYLKYILIIGAASLFIVFLFLPFIRDAICKNFSCGPFNYFDALNALFTGLAFVGVVVTILMQKDELIAQRKELELTREEVAGQREEMEEQNKTMALQRFEHSFFTVLEMHSKLVDGFFMEAGKYGNANNLSGKSVLQFISDKMVFWADPKPEEDNQFVFGSNYPADNNFRIFLDQYFGSFYNLYEQILKAPENKDKWYSDIVRSRLIEAELVLLYLHAIYGGPEGFKFKPIIEKYALLKNVGVRISVPSRGHGISMDAYDGILY